MISRRHFLGGIGLAGLASSAVLRRVAFAAPSGKTLVVVFQRGAVDGLSMVVPHGDKAYLRQRPEIGIRNAIDLDGFFGLHPAMATLHDLYRHKQLAVVHACGSPNATRSHFDSQDAMESGVVDDKSVVTGWLDRALVGRPTSPFRAVAMTSLVPRSLQGQGETMAIADLDTFGVRHASGGGFEDMYAGAVGDVLGGAGKDSFDAMGLLKKMNPAQIAPAHGAVYPAGTFGRALRQTAQLIKAKLGVSVAFVEVDGWDTHANQGAATGALAGRLSDFASGLAAFARDLGDGMNDVCVVTMTEFGRAVRQNGNRGTDHGHGSAFMVLGGELAGGKVYGRWPGLDNGQLYEDRDLAVTTDYRDVLTDICVRHIGIAATKMAPIFPGHRATPVGLFG